MVGSKTCCVRASITAALVVAALLVAVAVVVVVVVVRAKKQNCQVGDLRELATMCGRYVKKAGPTVDPSPGCCDVIKGSDVMCVCQHIPKDIELMVDTGKVAYVAQFCGNPLPAEFKCGG